MNLLDSIRGEINRIRYRPTQKDIETVKSASWEQCAAWWRELNHWGWPEVFGEAPKESDSYYLNNRRSQIMGLLDNKVGQKYILRYHNVISGEMTEAEYEDWWNGMHGSDRARKRHMKKVYGK